MEPQNLNSPIDFQPKEGMEYCRQSIIFPDKVRAPTSLPSKETSGFIGRLKGLLGMKDSPNSPNVPLSRIMSDAAPDNAMMGMTYFKDTEWDTFKNATVPMQTTPGPDTVHQINVLKSEGYTLIAQSVTPYSETLYWGRPAVDKASSE